MAMQYTEIFRAAKLKIFIKKGLIFFLVLLKDRLLVYRTEYPQSMFNIKIKKTSIPLYNPNNKFVGGCQ